MDIIGEIRAGYDALSKKHKHIANYVLDNTSTVCFLTLKELSVKLGITESTVLSFCTKLSCGNYVGLKKALQEYVQHLNGYEENFGSSTGEQSLINQSYDTIMSVDRGNLNRTFEHLDREELMAFISAIKNAGIVYIVGSGTSSAVALYFQIRMQQLGFRGTVINSPDNKALLYRIANSEKNDIFVMLDFADNSSQNEALSEYLHKTDFSMYCITNRASSPVARFAKAVLICSTDQNELFDSMTAPIAIVNLIFSAIILENLEGYAVRMEDLGRIESFLLNPL